MCRIFLECEAIIFVSSSTDALATDVSVFPRWHALNDKCLTLTTAAKYMRMPQLNDNALNIELNNLAQQPTLMGPLEYTFKCFAPFIFITAFFTTIFTAVRTLAYIKQSIWDTYGSYHTYQQLINKQRIRS